MILMWLITAILIGPIAFSVAKKWHWRYPYVAAIIVVVALWVAEALWFVWAQTSDLGRP